MASKTMYIIAGPNGSGKTTFAKEWIRHYHDTFPFINADEIAMEHVSPSNISHIRLHSGKEFFERVHQAQKSGVSFAIETTLAGNYLERIIHTAHKQQYEIVLIYIFIENEKEAIRRIAFRVKKGGHAVPIEDIRRRFMRSKRNFWNTYKNIVDEWIMFFNNKDEFLQVATGSNSAYEIIHDDAFRIFMEGINEKKTL